MRICVCVYVQEIWFSFFPLFCSLLGCWCFLFFRFSFLCMWFLLLLLLMLLGSSLAFIWLPPLDIERNWNVYPRYTKLHGLQVCLTLSGLIWSDCAERVRFIKCQQMFSQLGFVPFVYLMRLILMFGGCFRSLLVIAYVIYLTQCFSFSISCRACEYVRVCECVFSFKLFSWFCSREFDLMPYINFRT